MVKMKKSSRKVKALTAVLAGAMVMTTAASVTASAQTSQICDNTLTAVNKTTQQMQEAARTNHLRDRRWEQLTTLRGVKKEVTVLNCGGYTAKNVKLYGRKIVSVDNKGEYVLGNWELLGGGASTLSGIGLGGYSLTISGDYVSFAFSFDVKSGTDFPYSGVFWNDVYNYGWDEINIELSGTCRMADIEISVGGRKVVDEWNCSSHTEWTPN